MRAGRTVVLMLLAVTLTAGVVWCADDDEGELELDPRVPNTLVEIPNEETRGIRVASYSFFFVLAAFCVLLVFRGIRAR